MKLLLDENLSPSLVEALSKLYPDSVHVDSVGLHGQPDERIWRYARDHDYVLVSKDSDFRQLSVTYGSPPKIVWLSVGNAGTSVIRELLASNRTVLESFLSDTEAALLVLPLAPEQV